MNAVEFPDVGGYKINPADLMTEEMLGYIKNINPKLGTEEDPYYNDYVKFKRELDDSEILTIDYDDINGGERFDDMDLSGTETEDITEEYFCFDLDGGSMETPMVFFKPEIKYHKPGGGKIECVDIGDDIENMVTIANYKDYVENL